MEKIQIIKIRNKKNITYICIITLLQNAIKFYMILRFICQDNYEAEKLASVFALQKDNSLFINEITKVIENEVIVKLKDGSHHSIAFKDNYNALLLKKMFSEILLAKNKVISIYSSGNELFMDLK